MTLNMALTNLEILCTVCQFSDPSDDIKLLYVSRSFFNATIPFVWNSLRGVENLLELIPGVTCVSTEEEPEVLNVTIPSEILSERFNVYAPLVKHLEIFNKDIDRYSVPGWWRLMELTRDQALLPKLTRLTLQTPSPSNTQTIMWIQLFLSPTLIEVSVVPLAPHQQSFLPCLEASALIRYINFACPSLKFLSLFPDKEEMVDYKNRPCDSHALLFEFQNSSFPRQLEQLRSLTELCTTTAVLMPSGSAHSTRLPHLKNLAIYPTPSTFVLGKLAPENPFPALQEFSLNWAPHTLPVDVWRLPMFTHVTSITLSFITQPKADDMHEWASLLVIMICDNSPNLINLSINFDYADKYDSIDLTSRPVIQPMQKLPLHTLELASAHIEEGSDTARLIPSIWSQITVLKLPDNLTGIEDLTLFSGLPALEHLVVELSLSTPPPKQNPVPSSQRNLHFTALQSSSKIDITGDFYEIAQWLLDMWPAIRYVTWLDSAKNKTKSASQSGSKALAIGLNRTINMLRGLGEAKLRLSQAYGPDALKMFQEGL